MVEIDRLALGLVPSARSSSVVALSRPNCRLTTACSWSRSRSDMLPVDRGGVNKQRRRRETIVMVLEMGRMLAVFGDLGQEFAKVFEHT